MEFNERLKKARHIMGLTQVEFAELGGVKAVTQTNYERGIRFPTLEYLLNLKKNGVDINFVIFGEVQEQATLSDMESRLLLAYRNGGFERKKAIEFVAGIYDENPPSDSDKRDSSNHGAEIKKNEDNNNLFSTYYLGDVVRNVSKIFSTVMPVFLMAAILFWGVIHILITEFTPLFPEGSLVANLVSAGIAVIALLFIVLGSIKMGERLLNPQDSNFVRLRRLKALLAK